MTAAVVSHGNGSGPLAAASHCTPTCCIICSCFSPCRFPEEGIKTGDRSYVNNAKRLYQNARPRYRAVPLLPLPLCLQQRPDGNASKMMQIGWCTNGDYFQDSYNFVDVLLTRACAVAGLLKTAGGHLLKCLSLVLCFLLFSSLLFLFSLVWPTATTPLPLEFQVSVQQGPLSAPDQAC